MCAHPWSYLLAGNVDNGFFRQDVQECQIPSRQRPIEYPTLVSGQIWQLQPPIHHLETATTVTTEHVGKPVQESLEDSWLASFGSAEKSRQRVHTAPNQEFHHFLVSVIRGKFDGPHLHAERPSGDASMLRSAPLSLRKRTMPVFPPGSNCRQWDIAQGTSAKWATQTLAAVDVCVVIEELLDHLLLAPGHAGQQQLAVEMLEIRKLLSHDLKQGADKVEPSDFGGG